MRDGQNELRRIQSGGVQNRIQCVTLRMRDAVLEAIQYVGGDTAISTL